MRQSSHQIKFPSPKKLYNFRTNYLSANHKQQPIKVMEKSPQIIRHPPLPNRINMHRYTHTEQIHNQSHKYPYKYIPQLVPKSISPIRINKNIDNKQSHQTTRSSKTVSQLQMIHKDSHKSSNNEYSLSAIGSDISDLPSTLKQQPNFMLFLCTNCYQYFLLPQRAIHTSTCTFQQSQHELNIKINRIIGVLKIINTKYPHRFIRAIYRKLQEYQQKQINLEDILLLEMLIVNSPAHPDIDWKQLFWAIKELIKIKQKCKHQKRSFMQWMFCK